MRACEDVHATVFATLDNGGSLRVEPILTRATAHSFPASLEAASLSNRYFTIAELIARLEAPQDDEVLTVHVMFTCVYNVRNVPYLPDWVGMRNMDTAAFVIPMTRTAALRVGANISIVSHTQKTHGKRSSCALRRGRTPWPFLGPGIVNPCKNQNA